MKLTPLDIRHKEFKRGMRGYADVEVDEFLDEIADEYERLFKENIDLQERVETLEEKVTGYKRIEETLQKTLVNAQASAEEQKQNANKEAQLILQDAELKARQMVNEAYTERQGIEQSLAKLRNSEEDFRFKFQTLLEGYLRQLKETPKTTGRAATDPASDFARHAEAIKEAIARESVPVAPREEAAEPEAEPAAVPESHGASPYVADADAAPDLSPQHAPDAPTAAPARGPGGVQAGDAPPAARGRAGAGDDDDPDARRGGRRREHSRRRLRRGAGRRARADRVRRDRRSARRRGHRGERERVQVVRPVRSPRRGAASACPSG